MDILSDKVTYSWFTAEVFLYALLPLFLASVLFYRNQQRSRLPPLCSLTLRERAALFLEGRIHHRFLEISKEIGLVYRLSVPFQISHHFVVCDATLGRLILEGDSSRQIMAGEKRVETKLFDKITINKPNILTKKTHGEGWDWARKGVASAFSKTNLEKKLPEIRHKIAQFTAILDQHIDGNKPLTDFPSWMVKLTIDFISTIGFDGDFHTIGSDDSLFETDGKVYLINLPITIKEFVLRQWVNVIRRVMFWLPEIQDANKSASKIADVGQKVLDRYRASHSEEEIEADSSIIGHLVRSPYPTELERIADVTIFMLAGHDTTGYQVSWIIIECIKHPDVLLKLRKELDKVFAVNSPIDCTPAQLSELLYLGQIIKEGMRLRPVIANGSQRELLQDILYKEFVLPKGSSVALSFWTIMRTGIQKPDDFIPERWADDGQDKEKLKELFMPFASGRRGCVGQSLALLELKVVLATLFYSYDFEIISEIKEMSSLTLKPMNANLRVLHRKK